MKPEKAFKDAEHALRVSNDPALAKAIARTALRLKPDNETRGKIESLLIEIERISAQLESDPYDRIKRRVYDIVGTGYEGRAEIIRANCIVGTILKLQREPNNSHDEHAVAVYARSSGLFARWKKIGYLRKSDNEDVAELLDVGHRLTAQVSKLYAPQHREFPKIHVRIRQGA